MAVMRTIVLAAAALGLAGCADHYDRPYGGYSYASAGYGTGYSRPYYGWYNDYYYPGTGVYVYDRRGVRQRWNRGHRDYWRDHRRYFRDERTWRGRQPNWSGWRGPPPREYRGRRGRR